MDESSPTPGDRIKQHRERAGMSRPVLGGLVGRSAEWVKAVETGRLLPPRLPMLIRIGEVLEVADLADLTGEQRLSTSSYTKAGHDALPAVAEALASYPVAPSDAEPATAEALRARVSQAWELWHGSRHQRTVTAALLPSLLRDGRIAVRRLEGNERRAASVALAETYHLAQLFLSFQPVPELVFMAGDRAMTAAQDADDPRAMAVAAWYMNHVYRDAGEQHESRVTLAADVASLLRPEESAADRVRWGMLQLASALSFAKMGREGDAWRYWDRANDAARALGDDYAHPFLIFGPGMVDAYAVTMNVDLMRGGEAAQQADRLDLSAMPSRTRRSFHNIETARAHHLRQEPVATVHLLRKAHDESPDTFRYNLFARSVVSEMRERGGATVRDDVADLSGKLGLPA